MKIFEDIVQLNTQGTIIAVGKFDGVHKGHRKLISEMIAHKGNLETLVFTFRRQSDRFFLSDSPIFTEKEQTVRFEELGVDMLLSFPLTEANIHIKAEAFVKDILVDKLNMKKIICGEDFRFGFNKEGDVDILRKLGERYSFETIIISKEEYDGAPISSSRIRKAIMSQNEKEIRAML